MYLGSMVYADEKAMKPLTEIGPLMIRVQWQAATYSEWFRQPIRDKSTMVRQSLT